MEKERLQEIQAYMEECETNIESRGFCLRCEATDIPVDAERNTVEHAQDADHWIIIHEPDCIHTMLSDLMAEITGERDGVQ